MHSISTPDRFVPEIVISGGQTGVDRAALDVAIELGIEHGGWCPRGRLAEDGMIPMRYNVRENGVDQYPARTRQNIEDSDATLILYRGRMSGGTALTLKICRDLGCPHLSLKLDRDGAEKAREWLNEVQPHTLNVAGTRESSSPGIADAAKVFLRELFS